MIEAHIRIEKELAAEGWKRALWPKALRDIGYFYAVRLTVIWVLVSIANGIYGVGHLNSFHLAVFVIIGVGATGISFYEWRAKVERDTVGWEFVAELNEIGVITQSSSTEVRNWSFYKQYVERARYLEIEDENGNITFIPKTPELKDAIEFTKKHIKEKGSRKTS